MQPATRGDGLRLQLTGTDVISMRVVGAISGVVVLNVGARNGPGIGRLIASLGGNLAWQAPGSATPGMPQPVGPDAAYLLEDGDDPQKFVRVQVYNSYLPVAGESLVYVADRYNELGPDDVTAAEATAGELETVEYTLANVSVVTVYNVKLWIERSGVDSRGITVSSDGITFVNPGDESTALTWSSIAPGASVNVWMQRTIPANTTFSPARLNQLQFSWTGL